MLHVGFKQYVRKNKVLSITKEYGSSSESKKEAEDEQGHRLHIRQKSQKPVVFRWRVYRIKCT